MIPSCHPDRPHHAKGLCRNCYRSVRWRENPEIREQKNTYHRNKRVEAVMILGGVCVACGETDTDVLQIDHKFGGGRAEARTRGGNRSFYLDIVAGRRSLDDLQVLCANDHMRKSVREQGNRV